MFSSAHAQNRGQSIQSLSIRFKHDIRRHTRFKSAVRIIQFELDGKDRILAPRRGLNVARGELGFIRDTRDARLEFHPGEQIDADLGALADGKLAVAVFGIKTVIVLSSFWPNTISSAPGAAISPG